MKLSKYGRIILLAAAKDDLPFIRLIDIMVDGAADCGQHLTMMKTDLTPYPAKYFSVLNIGQFLANCIGILIIFYFGFKKNRRNFSHYINHSLMGISPFKSSTFIFQYSFSAGLEAAGLKRRIKAMVFSADQDPFLLIRSFITACLLSACRSDASLLFQHFIYI